METPEAIDTYYTDKPVCPRCGYPEEADWELEADDGTIFCAMCGKEYNYFRHITWSYCTEIPKKVQP